MYCTTLPLRLPLMMLAYHASMHPRRHAHPHRDSNAHATDGHGARAIAALSTDAAPLRRRNISKNCTSLRKYGDRLFIRRRHRSDERIVVEDVERMREALATMDRQLTLLDSVMLNRRQNAEGASMHLVSTYFRHMKHGLNPPAVEYDRTVTKPFIEAAFTADLKCPDFTGLDQFFQQWEYVTKYHQLVTMENQFMAALPADTDNDGNDVYVIKTSGVTACQISRDTIEYFFPHILQDEELVQWLIGKQYAYGYTMILHVNHHGQVFQFESLIDLASGLLMLLRDPMVTLKLIESSMWTKSGNLRGEVQENQIAIENGFL